ncbi:DUF2147 domain-containing protein [Moraxella lincolnii]|uniref:DUF2147 domain-containing protein n=1 Tax=Lwoffella lincolnii TaxID=90241 RepID=A0A1T0CJ87_9GAMM|nr:DUF2147 domain-containing protein [Moraxella lincolnii]OOS22418.1 hypothetical protein B0682_02010 [Moraxella lincolnii]
MKFFTQSAIALATFALTTVVMANDPLADTMWQTFDNGKPKATVQITQSGDTFSGKIIDTNREEGKKFVGTTVFTGLKADGNGKYSGGKITDPENGKTYKMSATLKANTLAVRGHLGPFHRTQNWKKK